MTAVCLTVNRTNIAITVNVAIFLRTAFFYITHLVATSELKSNISNVNLDRSKKKLFLYFDASHTNQSNNFFSYIVNIYKNLKSTDEKKCSFKHI